MTPNSFSDQGKSLEPDFFKKQLQSFLNDESVIIDFGFESTAPMNKSISAEEEKKRFDDFLVLTKEFSFEDRFVSFDTYKIKNFKYMAFEFKKIHPLSHIIFNDVSGSLEDELREALLEFKHSDFYYIYTFSHIPERSQTLDHQKYQDAKKNVIDEAALHFSKAHAWFKSFEMEHQLILDPGFGFSKTYDQNWKLIGEFSALEEKLLEMKIMNPILVGLSKKSFLKKAVELDPESNLEDLHKSCLRKISNGRILNILFRVHDPKIIKGL